MRFQHADLLISLCLYSQLTVIFCNPLVTIRIQRRGMLVAFAQDNKRFINHKLTENENPPKYR